MKTLGDARTHFWLVQGMAHRVGADLPGAFQNGSLSAEEWSGMITRCRGCEKPGACQRFLDATETAEDTPDYCRNSDRLLELARD